MDKILYEDTLIKITDDSLILKRFYFPFGGERTISLWDMEKVNVEEPHILNGRFRYWGMNFFTWFGLDWKRHTRDAIFTVHLKDKYLRVGFTTESSKTVIDVLKKKRVLVESEV